MVQSIQQKLLERINAKLKGELEDKELRRLSTKVIERKILLHSHNIRLEEDAPPEKDLGHRTRGKS